MRKRSFGKLPVWIVVTLLVLMGAGAAVGTVLAGQTGGTVPVTVSQALKVDVAYTTPVKFETSVNTEYSTPLSVTALPDRYFTSHADDGTGFTAAAELDTGDETLIRVYLDNQSKEDLVGELTLILPVGITANVEGDNVSKAYNVTRTGLYTWKMDVDDTAGDTAGNAYIIVQLAVADDINPGFFSIDGTLKQVAY